MAARAGVDVVRRSFYSPIPRWEDVPDEAFARASPMHGIAFDLEEQVATLRHLQPFLAEFEPPAGFGWGNRMYGRVEADVLYALVRRHRPQRVIELGSGSSSLIIAAALRRNAHDGRPGAYAANDPFAPAFVEAIPEVRLHRRSAADVPLDEFRALERDDVLFVDTTHTVKLGSEVNRLVLDVLPVLGPGVLVHVHDVFLPYEYPRSFFEKGLFWAEQYLLQAFLVHNPHWRVLLPTWALVRDRPEAVAELVGSYLPGCGPGAFWMVRTG